MRKSRTSSMVRSPVVSRVRSALLKGESRGGEESRGEDRALWESSANPGGEGGGDTGACLFCFSQKQVVN